ncbi:hypothetical protein SAMN04487982_108249 [Streptomyces sp. ok210]|nr:hypothetical protein SAMN04487982_108249 [Streptomyces sp. ok210]
MYGVALAVTFERQSPGISGPRGISRPWGVVPAGRRPLPSGPSPDQTVARSHRRPGRGRPDQLGSTGSSSGRCPSEAAAAVTRSCGTSPYSVVRGFAGRPASSAMATRSWTDRYEP